MTLYDEQIEREKQSVSQGIERLRQAIEIDRAKGREFDNVVGQAMVKRLIERTVERVGDLRREAKKKSLAAKTTGARTGGWEDAARLMDVDTLAFITLRTMCNAVGRGLREQQIAKTIGDMCNMQVQYEELQAQERARVKGEDPDPRYNRLAFLRREVKQINPKSLRKWLKKLDDLATTQWDQQTKLALGGNLMEVVMDELSDIFWMETIMTKLNGKVSKKNILRFTDEAHKRLDIRLAAMGANSPWLQPMVCMPKPWTATDLGGYYTIHREFVKALHDNTYEGEVPEVVYTAINAMQETGWRINEPVLAVAKAALDGRVEVVLPVSPVKDLPVEKTKDEWEALDDHERAAVKAERRATHDKNHRQESKRQVVYRQVHLAETLAGREIFFPHNLDFRGRAYPLPQDLHPQCDDFGKALLTFSTPLALGHSGLRWLQYHVANSFGCDKMTRDEQLDWVASNADWITTVAVDPLGAGLDFWSEAEDKWQFLAACIELDNAWQLEDATAYVCSLPVYVDGSCNGLQHLSAMGRDPVGAKAVNLCSGPRQDIYQIVADKVMTAVGEDHIQTLLRLEQGINPGLIKGDYTSNPCSVNWLGKVTRKTVKRGVMTKPYGLTHVGMRDQLIDDRAKTWPDVEGDIRENATYMRDLMAAAIEDTVHASVHVMDWMQQCAKVMADVERGIQWTAPTGFVVEQYYQKQAPRRYSVAGVFRSTRRRITMQEPVDGIMKAKQVQAIAPNIVHSFDAAHMMLTVDAAAKQGIEVYFSTVHDSYGVHPSNMDAFLVEIKRTFMMIYEADVLMELYHEFVAQAEAAGLDREAIPHPPELGDFDIAEVAGSDFFFA
jgi:DNA-directed RNA polymerase